MDKSTPAGRVHVDSAQILILDPGRLTETQYESVILAKRADGAAEVWIDSEPATVENFLDPVRRTNDGVVVDTGADGSFPVYVNRGADGEVLSIRIDIG